ncbi:hypothetical protein [Marimonas arenosa]|uniref:Uncharacterized protein n=1 Tax=Marimonas arenosa TaxID=1795305 RepID=A0AAE3WD65_9RHOB|nr:hypothetical protein [Marimonas arenosa]MDQ2089500.1 hypothetical protein [Marimonas arenosa]
MNLSFHVALLTGALAVAGCSESMLAQMSGEGGDGRVNSDKTIDYGQGGRQKPLSELVAGIWVDPNGCDHWIIDDGVEGYLSPRLDRNGKPVCSGVAPPNTAVGNFRGNETISDPL